MACPPDSEDGDLAVYKIDGGFIGDDEITVDDIERLGGTRMLCVYKHGFDGIEGIRDFANRMAIHEFRERVTVRDPFGDLPDLAPPRRSRPPRAAARPSPSTAATSTDVLLFCGRRPSPACRLSI